MATAELVLPQVLENTARNWLLLCDALAVKLSGLDVAPGILVNPLPLLACHCSVGPGKPLPAAVNDTNVPAQAFVLSGLMVTAAAALIVRVATAELVLPQAFENTARNWLLLCDALAVKLNGLDVAPGILVNPLPLLACHCSVGPGAPLAAAVNDATAPVQTLLLTGSRVTAGAVLTVNVATAEAMLPQVFENTARNWLLLCDALAGKLNGLDVAPGILVNPAPLLACHCNVGPGAPLAAAVNDATAPVQTPALTGSSVTAGAVLTVNVATVEVVLPQVLL
jgi:hypothetical protein